MPAPQDIASSAKCLLAGDAKEMICPRKENVASKKTIQGVEVDLMSRIAATRYK